MIMEPTISGDEAIELAKARRLQMLRERIKQIEENNGMACYKPHSKQDLFHRAGKFPRRYLRTGNRFGKSTVGSAEDCAWAIGERIWYPKSDPARYEGIPKRAVKGLIIVQDWDKAEEIFTSQTQGAGKGKLFKMLPSESVVSVDKNQAGNVCRIVVKSVHGGMSELNLDTIKSFKANPMGQESSDWDFIHVDEPCPEEMWTAVSRGLIDREGSAWFTCTPIIEVWINDLFYPRGQAKRTFENAIVSADGNYWALTGSMHDNPTLTTKSKQLFISTLSAEERAARVDGKPRALAGQIFNDYDEDKHQYRGVPVGWDDHDKPSKEWTIRVAIDTHGSMNSNQAVLMVATGPLGHSYFFAEVYERLDIPTIADLILLKLDGRDIYQAPLEPGAFIEHPSTGRRLADDFLEAGIPVELGSKDLDGGISKVQEGLKLVDPKTGEPMWRFSPTLTEFHDEIDRYVWTSKGRPYDKRDHMMENFRRLVMTGLTWVPNVDRSARGVVKPVRVGVQSLQLPTIRGLVMPLRAEKNQRSNYKKLRYR